MRPHEQVTLQRIEEVPHFLLEEYKISLMTCAQLALEKFAIFRKNTRIKCLFAPQGKRENLSMQTPAHLITKAIWKSN